MLKTIALMLCLAVPAHVCAQAHTIQPEIQTHLQADDSVYDIQSVEGHPMTVRLLSATAGDPALNGLYLSLAVKSKQQWHVYFLKDIASYQILPSAKAGYLKLRLANDMLNETGFVDTRHSLLFVNMTAAAQTGGTITIEEIPAAQP